ncbi:hypothetical protein RRG08_008955 [Elysia crispata]|uniref:Uncharacterized protein n=1 Tax=Elysia crispata TaxID=231223 RepID=A0AAE1DYQ3_9GAST|nr:hypothetical protein RRG08_008955 [Elysia crispata]
MSRRPAHSLITDLLRTEIGHAPTLHGTQGSNQTVHCSNQPSYNMSRRAAHSLITDLLTTEIGHAPTLHGTQGSN